MKLKKRKVVIGKILKCSPKRVWLDQARLEEITQAITKSDLRKLITEGAIKKVQEKGISKVRARIMATKKSKGLRRSHGSRKGAKGARTPRKETWILRIRNQRDLISILKTKKLIDDETYKDIYAKASGGFFRSRNHIKLYLTERGLIKNTK